MKHCARCGSTTDLYYQYTYPDGDYSFHRLLPSNYEYSDVYCLKAWLHAHARGERNMTRVRITIKQEDINVGDQQLRFMLQRSYTSSVCCTADAPRGTPSSVVPPVLRDSRLRCILIW